MKQVLYSVPEVVKMISAGKNLILAGESNLLRQLPSGNWIGGSIPYFMLESGGGVNREQIYVTELPDYITGCTIKTYTVSDIANIYKDPETNGFSVVIIPASSNTHTDFALNAPGYDMFATRPLIGWISGVHLEDLSIAKPVVFCGLDPQPLNNTAVVMHVGLPETKYATVQIVNIFSQGNGDEIVFPSKGFSANEAFINGKRCNFADYLRENNIDTRMPLVANYCGAKINTSFLGIDSATKTVNFYAPVFQGPVYKLANPITDYVGCFNQQLPKEDADSIFFSCNCILNYLYSELEGKPTGGITGPITFGEIGYQLLNQTMVYLTISDLK
ncbi:MAG TPA: hypothetical protein VEC37_02810 [Bacillota bacterium]|nr:hypothetical protein [Bacillota bacterium]